jgi:hypothetical protein
MRGPTNTCPASCRRRGEGFHRVQQDRYGHSANYSAWPLGQKSDLGERGALGLAATGRSARCPCDSIPTFFPCSGFNMLAHHLLLVFDRAQTLPPERTSLLAFACSFPLPGALLSSSLPTTPALDHAGRRPLPLPCHHTSSRLSIEAEAERLLQTLDIYCPVAISVE